MKKTSALEWLALAMLAGVACLGLAGLVPWDDVWRVLQKEKAADWAQAIVSALAIVIAAGCVVWQVRKQRIEARRLPWMHEHDQVLAARELIRHLRAKLEAIRLSAGPTGNLTAYLTRGHAYGDDWEIIAAEMDNFDLSSLRRPHLSMSFRACRRELGFVIFKLNTARTTANYIVPMFPAVVRFAITHATGCYLELCKAEADLAERIR